MKNAKKKIVFSAMACGLVMLLLSIPVKASLKKSFYLNLSGSTPLGLYRVTSTGSIEVGDLVIFDPPEGVHTFIYGRGWLPSGWPLIKYVGAVSGDTYAVEGSRFFINGKHVGQVFTGDSEGKPLPVIKGTVKVKPGEFLPVSTHISNSFDGRYFGPISLSAIRGKATPVWTY